MVAFLTGVLSIIRPFRAMIGVQLWAKKARRDMAALHPDLENSEISSILGQEWKQLTAAQREVYVRGSKTLRDEHKKMCVACLRHPAVHSHQTVLVSANMLAA